MFGVENIAAMIGFCFGFIYFCHSRPFLLLTIRFRVIKSPECEQQDPEAKVVDTMNELGLHLQKSHLTIPEFREVRRRNGESISGIETTEFSNVD